MKTASGRALLLAVTVAVVAVGLVAIHASDGQADPPAGHTSTGGGPGSTRAEPTPVPWWQDGVLHVAGAQIATPLREIRFAGGTTLVGRSVVDHARWYVVRHDRLTPLVDTDVDTGEPLQPVLSADGRWAAWAQVTHRRSVEDSRSVLDYRVVAYDVAAGRVVGVWHTTRTVRCCDATGSLVVPGVDLDGRVLLQAVGGRSLVWVPGRRPVVVRGLGAGHFLGGPWPRGVTWQGSEAKHGSSGYGTVDARGRVHPVGTMPELQAGSWSPDGTAYAYGGDGFGRAPYKTSATNLWFRHLHGAPVMLRVPGGSPGEILAWEDRRQVLVRPDRRSPLVRCDAASGDCTAVGDGPGLRAVLPLPY